MEDNFFYLQTSQIMGYLLMVLHMYLCMAKFRQKGLFTQLEIILKYT